MSKPQNVKGMRDHLPQAMLLRQQIITILTQVFEQHGFEPLSTPVVEYAETIEGKLGDEEKLIYRFEDHGGRKLALRYDQTVPLARVVAQYAGQISFPWRRYAIGPSYRGERPARGRYREFWQADADLVGSPSPLADAEIIAILTESLTALGFSQFTTLLNHRQILGGIARISGLAEAEAGNIYRAIDKLDKIGADGVREELLQSNISPEAAERLLALVLLEGDSDTILQELTTQLQGDEKAQKGLRNLREIILGLEAMGVSQAHYQVSPRLARGLSYYTGVVFEAITAHWPQGSLLGGGRYDELIGMFAKQPVPTVGLAFGIDRLHDVMAELEMNPALHTTSQVFITLFSSELVSESLLLAADLRREGIKVVTSLESGNLGKQFKEADRKGIRFVLVLGPDEVAKGEVVVKDLMNGTQQSVKRENIVAAVS